MRDLLLLYFLGAGAHTALALSPQARCYFPNGAIASGNFPCFLDQSDSPCCGVGFICEASGLCKVPHSTGVSELIRGACTDSTWNSPSCPNYCTDAATGGTNFISCQNVTMSPVDFCCDHTNGCCDSGIGRFQVQSNVDVLTLGTSGATISTSAPKSSSLASSSATTTITTTASSASSTPSLTSSGTSSRTTSSSTNLAQSETPSSTATPESSGGSGLSSGAKVGIGIACAIGGLTIVGAVLYFCMRKRKHPDSPSDLPKTGSPETGLPEMHGISRPSEIEAQPAPLKGSFQRVELAA